MDSLYRYLLMLGDNAMILGHRLSELCGHGPNLETDIALTNISLDLFGQVRMYFQYAAEIKGGETSEDSIAFLRKEREHFNVLLVEQKNIDFAYIICRQYLYDAFHVLLMQKLIESSDDRLKAIAVKVLKEVKYHHRFSQTWFKRLSLGTELSKQKMQAAIDFLYPYTQELVKCNSIEKEMEEKSIAPGLNSINDLYFTEINKVLKDCKIVYPDNGFFYKGGKEGIHSEHLGFILSDLQYMQRTYPNMQW